MPAATFDGLSFMLDAKRIWLVSGRLDYARMPRELWADRLRDAKLAGLNTIDTAVVWARHEPIVGRFNFKGDNDIRHYLQLAEQAGLHVILRPGPFIGDGWDFGGMPAWVAGLKDVRLRTANPSFLEACSRYIGALAEQVRDLQVVSPKGGPLILIQPESGWTCGHEELAHSYLGEIDRYLRESGLTVPLINSNNLWQGREGQIDGWVGAENMLAMVRQLGTVRPDQPRVVVEFPVGSPGSWRSQPTPPIVPEAIQERLAEILAAGGQFNIVPFCGGTNLGFSAGRLADGPASYATTSNDRGGVLAEDGSRGPAYALVRRICTFASRFSRVMSHLDPSTGPVAIDPARERGKISVVHASGSQGGVAFVFAPPGVKGKPGEEIRLVLPNGTSMGVTPGGQGVTWCLFDAHLGGRSTLDWCSVNALAVVGSVFVCFGPGGTTASMSINGSPLEVSVPVGDEPTVLEHEGVTVVVASEAQADESVITDDAVYFGVGGLSRDGTPIAAGGRGHIKIDGKGRLTRVAPVKQRRAPREKASIEMGAWGVSSQAEYADGTCPRYATIAGPADLAGLGSPYGYGWYRIELRGSTARRVPVVMPGSGDRLQLFIDGHSAGVVGFGGEPTIELNLKSGAHTLVVLAENLGRFSDGVHLGEPKGLVGHAWEHRAISAGKPVLKRGEPIDILAWRAPLWEVHRGDSTLPDRLTWTFNRRGKGPLLLHTERLPGRALVVVKNQPVAILDRSTPMSLVLSEDVVKSSVALQLAFFPEVDPEAITPGSIEVRFSEATAALTAKADWAFAKWEPPASNVFDASAKGSRATGPTWWRCEFRASRVDEPLFFEPVGLTKGQLYVNGRHLGRYYVADAKGKPVPPQSRYLIPGPALRADHPNELMIFDEFGGSPWTSRIVPAR